MGKGDRGHRETKKPKKNEKSSAKVITSDTAPPTPVEIIRKKRKGESAGAE